MVVGGKTFWKSPVRPLPTLAEGAASAKNQSHDWVGPTRDMQGGDLPSPTSPLPASNQNKPVHPSSPSRVATVCLSPRQLGLPCARAAKPDIMAFVATQGACPMRLKVQRRVARVTRQRRTCGIVDWLEVGSRGTLTHLTDDEIPFSGGPPFAFYSPRWSNTFVA